MTTRHADRPTVLILGATGKVGQMLQRIWRSKQDLGFRPVFQTRGPNDPANNLIHFTPGDDPGLFGHIDQILSLWGVTHGDAAALRANTDLALEAERIGTLLNVDRVFHASSIAVYADLPKPLCETDPIAPGNPYGMAKAEMEQAIAALTPAHRSTCLRIGSVAGAESLAHSVKTRGKDAVLTLHRFADGHGPSRSYFAPSDFAQALERLFAVPASTLPAVLNFGGKSPVRMEQLLEALDVPFDTIAAPKAARQMAVLDVTLLDKLIGLSEHSGDPAWIAQDWHRWG